jgi:hypothetical protein
LVFILTQRKKKFKQDLEQYKEEDIKNALRKGSRLVPYDTLQNIHTDKSEPYETKINDDSDSSAIYKSHKNIKLFKRLSANQKLFLPYLKPEKKKYAREFFLYKGDTQFRKTTVFFHYR